MKQTPKSKTSKHDYVPTITCNHIIYNYVYTAYYIYIYMYIYIYIYNIKK